RRERHGKIIDAVEAQVFEDPQRGSAPGAGNSRHDDEAGEIASLTHGGRGAARRLVLAVLFADQLVDLGRVGGVDQALSELVVLEQARDARKRLQMKTRGV